MQNKKNITDKPSFIIYKNFYEPIKSLSMEDRGKLFTAIFEYQINNTEIKLPDSCKMAFMFFKNQFDLDFNKWLGVVDRNTKNGRNGGRNSKPKKPSGVHSPPKNPIAPETETETETETVNDTVKEKEEKEIYKEKENLKNEFNEFWKLYPKKRAGSKDKAYKSFCKVINNKLITADRLIDVVKLYSKSDEVKRGFAKGCAAWLNDERFNDEYSVEKYDKKYADDWWRK